MVLNFPVGETTEFLIPLSQFGLARLLEYQSRRFSGYVVATIDGYSGIEEGLLFLSDGRVAGCAYSLDAPDVTVFGRTALPFFLNALLAPVGVADVYALSRQQLELILALDEKIVCEEPPGGLKKTVPASFAPELVRSVLPQASAPASHKKDLFKKIELTDLFS
jgi:hypothetical protein